MNRTRQNILLGVNIDHVATVRQARGTTYPDIVAAARAAERGGADAITIHLREDRRHIQDADVGAIAAVLGTRMNLEIAVTDEMLGLACELRPADVCLVPEKREELTTEGGLDVCSGRSGIARACDRLSQAGIRVSLFIDPQADQLKAACDSGANAVELHTGEYADAVGSDRQQQELKRIEEAAAMGSDLGLQVNAGHGLHYENTRAICEIPSIVELNIGHAIVSRALFVGLETAVSEMRALMDSSAQA